MLLNPPCIVSATKISFLKRSNCEKKLADKNTRKISKNFHFFTLDSTSQHINRKNKNPSNDGNHPNDFLPRKWNFDGYKREIFSG
jgi:hypothetical protein